MIKLEIEVPVIEDFTVTPEGRIEIICPFDNCSKIIDITAVKGIVEKKKKKD